MAEQTWNLLDSVCAGDFLGIEWIQKHILVIRVHFKKIPEDWRELDLAAVFLSLSVLAEKQASSAFP